MDYKKIFDTAREMLPDFIAEHTVELGDRKGLYLIICINIDNFSTHGILLGEISDPIALTEKMQFAQKKISELIITGNRTTFPTQFYPAQKYGGGITIDYGVYKVFTAVSGFNPKLEHKFLRAVLIKTNYLHGKVLDKVDDEFYWDQDKGVE